MAEQTPGTFRLWDKDFNLLATFEASGSPLYATLDKGDGTRWSGVVNLNVVSRHA